MENRTLTGLKQMHEMRNNLNQNQLNIELIEKELDIREYSYDQLEGSFMALIALLMKGDMNDAVRLSALLSQGQVGLIKLFDSLERV